MEAAPRLCRPFLFRNPPPAKNQNGEERQGEGRDARYSARGGIQRVATQSERTWRVKATTYAERAKLGVLFEMGSNFLIQ
jgi:hypothetical protein